MKVERVKITELSADPANVRLHPDRNIEAIKASLRRFGQQKPIVADSSGVVRAGNGTLAAAVALGWDEIAVVRTDLTGVDATAYAIADNRSSETSEWDWQSLSRVLTEMAQLDDEEVLLATGFDAQQVRALSINERSVDELQDTREGSEWVGMPEYSAIPMGPKSVVTFHSEEEREAFDKVLVQHGMVALKKTTTCWSYEYGRDARDDLESLRFTSDEEAKTDGA